MRKWIVRWTTDGFNTREEFNTKEEADKYYDKIIMEHQEYLDGIDLWSESTEANPVRQDLGMQLLNAKIELSKAINTIDELYENGQAQIEECGKLYNIKNELVEYINEFRKTLKGDE